MVKEISGKLKWYIGNYLTQKKAVIEWRKKIHNTYSKQKIGI